MPTEQQLATIETASVGEHHDDHCHDLRDPLFGCPTCHRGGQH